MRDGTLAGELADLPQQVLLAQPAGRRLRMRRDDQLVDPLECQRILDRRERASLEDVAQRRDSLLAQPRDRPVEPAAGGRTARVLVDHTCGARVAHRRDHDRPDGALLGARADGVDELVARERLVGHDEDDPGSVLVTCVPPAAHRP